MNVQAIEKALQTSIKLGLREKEVQKRQQKHGKNEMKTTQKQSNVHIFIKQFQDFIIFILLAATCIAALLGEFVDAIAILTIVFINAVIGFFQERKAEKALEKLKQLAAPKMTVFREGKWVQMDAIEAVPGDLIKLKVGDRVPADIRLIDCHEIATEEAALTGESSLIEKHALMLNSENIPIHDQKNMCFKGTLIMKGSGVGVVVQTGMETEIGKIATLIDTIEHVQTPLQWKLAQLGKILVITVLALTIITVLIGIYHGNPLYEMFLAGISLAVAVIPEGLPAIVTVVLSIGVQRMLKRKVIVRKLSAVETLGCATIICTDKTGTITENKMKVEQIYAGNQLITVTGKSEDMSGDFLINRQKMNEQNKVTKQLLLFGMLCNDATLHVKKGKYVMEGNPTDSAILVAARKYGLQENLQSEYTVIHKQPFDTMKRQMAVTVQAANLQQIEIVKGAPEVIIPTCSKMLNWHGQIVTFQQDKIEKQMNKMANQALRMIAICYRENGSNQSKDHRYIFAGLIGIFDPPRQEVPLAIEQCRRAGVETMMITGDHPHTAEAIGRLVGIDVDAKKVITGKEIEQLSMEELTDEIENVSIVARVNPTQKLSIIQALQNKGHVVAMTGDGINDAPAMKASNIGISMGISGTDVTKESAHIVLMDDNFSSIKNAIREGRHVYENIRKFIRYLLTSNVGEIFVMLAAMIIGLPLPLIPIQILWVNLVTDGLPAIALGLEKSTVDRMKQPPRDPKENIFSRGLATKIMTRGICIGIVTLFVFMMTYGKFPDQIDYARTVAFSTLVLAQLIHVFDCRSERGIFKQNPFSNPLLFIASSSSFLLLLVVVYVEKLQYVFQTVPLSLFDWFFIACFSAVPSIIFPNKQTENQAS